MIPVGSVRFVLNGRVTEIAVEPRVSLADMLRDELGQRSVHIGCEQGVCGSCNVLLDGVSVRSCLMPAMQADGHEVVTIEGLSTDRVARYLAERLVERHGLQCGFCTPGMIVSAVEYLRGAERPSDASVREVLSGNICRCTGYQGIVAAILDVADDLHDHLNNSHLDYEGSAQITEV